MDKACLGWDSPLVIFGMAKQAGRQTVLALPTKSHNISATNAPVRGEDEDKLLRELPRAIMTGLPIPNEFMRSVTLLSAKLTTILILGHGGDAALTL